MTEAAAISNASAVAGDTVLVQFNLNGKDIVVEVQAFASLAEVLRERLQLTGTKIGCGSAECGACTVHLDGVAVPACVTLAATIDGRSVTTIEGLSPDGEATALQQAFLENGAFQCGFCTSGMMMSAAALLQRNSCPSDQDIKMALQGNICRCTGYVQIIEAVRKACG
ncbi:(2Fe-2S)-binding protein [Ferrovibrio sp. MS7]|uniref:(2Fe-2S)-binding protein n=1 Tax=Ferrovibrio plantarum TaxID=3119164 RepID=UPI003136B979